MRYTDWIQGSSHSKAAGGRWRAYFANSRTHERCLRLPPRSAAAAAAAEAAAAQAEAETEAADEEEPAETPPPPVELSAIGALGVLYDLAHPYSNNSTAEARREQRQHNALLALAQGVRGEVAMGVEAFEQGYVPLLREVNMHNPYTCRPTTL